MQFRADYLATTAAVYKCNNNEFSQWLSTYLLAAERNSPLMVADSKLSESYLCGFPEGYVSYNADENGRMINAGYQSASLFHSISAWNFDR